MDKKTKLKYDPFGIVDMFYKQNWLEYQARKGLLLANDNLLTCRFTVDEPRDRRYRILPYKYNKMTQEELDLYASCGWSLIYGSGPVMIFYTDDPDAPEPFTDVQSQHKYYRRRFITNLLFISVIYINLLINPTISIRTILYPSDFLYSQADQPFLISVFYLSLIPLVILFTLQYIYTYGELLNKVRKRDFYSAKGFRKKYFINASVFIIAMLILIGAIINSPRTIQITSSGDFTQALKYKGNEIVRFSEFDPDTWKTVYKQIENYNDGKDAVITFDVSKDKTLLMPRIVSEELEVDTPMKKEDDETVMELYYNVHLYKAKSAKVASEFMKYNIKDVLEESNVKVSGKSLNKFRFDYEGLDYAAYIADEKKSANTAAKRDQLLFLRKGNKYVYVSYYGSIDLKSKVGLFAAKM